MPTSSAPTADNANLRFALAAAELASTTRCTNVILLDLRGKSPVAEYFVIATGSSAVQMRTVGEEAKDLGKRMNFSAFRTSGMENAKWILVDFVHVVVHVFDQDSRDFYDLELLWGDSPRIDWRSMLGLPPVVEVITTAAERRRMAEVASAQLAAAREEEDRLEGLEDENDESSVVVEFPGEDGETFAEIDASNTRRQRGKAVFPTPLEDEEDDELDHARSTASESDDEDDQQEADEAHADGDVEATASEDLPLTRIRKRGIGGVSANLSGTAEDDDLPRGQDDGDDEAEMTAPRATKKKPAKAVKTPAMAKKTAKPAAKKAPAKKASPAKPAKKIAVKAVKAKVVKKAAAKPVKKMATKKTAAVKMSQAKKVKLTKPAKKVAAKKTAKPAKKTKAVVKKPIKKASTKR